MNINEETGISIGANLSLGSSSSRWDPFSLNHLFSAFHFSHLSEVIEENFIRDLDQNNRNDLHEKYHYAHRSYVISSIVSSVAFLESTANEIFAGVADKLETVYANQLKAKYGDSITSLISTIWSLTINRPNASTPSTETRNFIERSEILNKYDILLSLCGCNALNSGEKYYQNVRTAIKIRNILVHYKPQILVINSDIDSISKTEKLWDLNLKQLEKEKQFASNRIYENDNSAAYFPNKMLGHGCAEWAAESAVEFIKGFCNGIGIQSWQSYQSVIDRAKEA
ncbi:MAG: hypothetical protein NW237_04050 [Cyanobacteriota bacterium]|nr:hypothetical protein [Cyanobacteriota bacterium]